MNPGDSVKDRIGVKMLSDFAVMVRGWVFPPMGSGLIL